MSNELKSIDFYESELKQVLTIADELAVSLDHLGSWFDTPEPAKEALSEYFGILGAGQRMLHLRGVLSEAVERTLGEDAYLEEREAVAVWPEISPPEGTELEDPWWGANTGSLIGDDVGRFDWPTTTDPSIPQAIIEQLRTVPTYLHGVYSVLDSPYWITDQDDFPQGLIAFAKSNGRICVDPTTGAVLKTSQYIIDETTPVNPSVGAFVRCAHAFTKHYPFYPENSDAATIIEISDKVYDDLIEADSAIYDYSSVTFWDDILDYFGSDRFATEHMQHEYHIQEAE